MYDEIRFSTQSLKKRTRKDQENSFLRFRLPPNKIVI